MPKIEGMTMAARLRFLAKRGQYGHSRKPHNYYPSGINMSDCPWEWMNRETGRVPIFSRGETVAHAWSILSEPTGFQWPQYQRLCTFSDRYRRFWHYMTEVLPDWSQTGEFHYADNSTEVEEVDRNGNKRRRTTVAPSGDACF